jgi:TRAP-type uncharacterized transport system substrate-binding protein
MRRILARLSFIAVLVLFASAANAAGFGTREEAVAMIKRVQEKFKKDGAQATFAAITDQAREFRDRDLYVYVLDYNCVLQASGANKALVGKSMWEFRDQDGIYPARNTLEIARTNGSGWTDYRWINPKTNMVEAKSTYVERLGDRYAAGVGIYKDEQINRNTVSIISGNPSSDATYLQVAYDLAAVLNDGDNLRVLPVVGIGGPQNIRDVRTLKGIDIGLTQVSILNNFRRANDLLGVHDDKIVYIAKLFNMEAHVVVRPDIKSLEQLQGQKVNLDELGSGTNYSMREVFKRLGIKIEEVNMIQSLALEKLKAGEIAATVLVAGKPTQSMSRLRASDGLTFLPIPYAPSLGNDFLPAVLTHDDYPELIPEASSVDTVADGAVLISYNWPKDAERYRRVETFVNAFFSHINLFFQPPHHVKWRDVNLNSTLDGWPRLEAAQMWLNNNLSSARLTPDARTGSTSQARSVSSPESQRLFEDFLKWQRTREGH